MRNPWGDSVKYDGEWSKLSPLWDEVNEDIKGKLGFSREIDGTFWIRYEDFLEIFSQVWAPPIRPRDFQ